LPLEKRFVAPKGLRALVEKPWFRRYGLEIRLRLRDRSEGKGIWFRATVHNLWPYGPMQPLIMKFAAVCV